jgi:hypothetical protein
LPIRAVRLLAQLTTKDGHEYNNFVQDAVGRGERQYTDQGDRGEVSHVGLDRAEQRCGDQIVQMVHDIEHVDDVMALTALLKK